MTVRAKTKRRLLILVIIAVVVVSTGAGWFVFRKQQIRKRYMAQRSGGLACIQAGDYATGLEKLADYIGRYPDDVEVLYELAEARLRIEMTDGKHIQLAAELLRRVLELDPSRKPVWRELALLYAKLGRRPETISAAERALEVRADDAEIRRIKAGAHLGLREFDKAMAIAQPMADGDPADLESQAIVLQAYRELGRKSEIVPRVQGLLLAHLGDARYNLLISLAYSLVDPFSTEESAAAYAVVKQAGALDYVRFELGLMAGKDVDPGRYTRDIAARVFARRALHLYAAATTQPAGASTQPSPSDSYFVKTLAYQLDHVQSPTEALRVMAGARLPSDDPWVKYVQLPRLWESSVDDEFERHFQGVDLRMLVTQNIELLGLHAQVLQRLGRAAEAEPIIKRLEDAKGNAQANAWVVVLREAFRRDADPAERNRRLNNVQNAVKTAIDYNRNARYPYLRYFMADALLRQGKRDQALESFRQASMAAPFWSAPRLQLSRLYRERGDMGLALDEARFAVVCMTSNINLLANYAVTWASQVPADSIVAEPRLGALVLDVQSRAFGEEQTFPLLVMLLAKTKPDEARKAIRDLLAGAATQPAATEPAIADLATRPAVSQPTRFSPSERLLLQLVNMSRGLNLGMEAEIEGQIERTLGVTPALAYSRAILATSRAQSVRLAVDELIRKKGTPEQIADAQAKAKEVIDAAASEVKRFDELRQKREVGTEPAWQVNWAQLLEAIAAGADARAAAFVGADARTAPGLEAADAAAKADAQAAAEWKTLADDPMRSSDLTIQKMVLEIASMARQSARELQAGSSDRPISDCLARSIERAHQLTGDGDIAWRIARAALLWRAKSADLRQITTILREALTASPDNVQAITMLSNALERSGDLAGAVEQAALAVKLRPESAILRLRLAGLYQAQADYTKAAEQLSRLRREALTPMQKAQAADLYARLGDTQNAAELLKGVSNDQVGASASLLRAELSRRRNDIAGAEAEYEQLLKTPDLRIILSAADFYATTGREVRAKEILALLDSDVVRKGPGDKELVLAQYTAARGLPTEAADLYSAAAKAQPTNSDIWKGLIISRLRANHIPEALAAAAEASAAVPDNQAFKDFQKRADLVGAASQTPGLIPLVIALLQGTSDRDVAAEALDIIANALRVREKTGPVLARLQPLADRAPGLVPLQSFVIQCMGALGQWDNATAVALRTMRAAPADPDAARSAAWVLRDAGQFAQALDPAARWRELTAINPLQADLFIAEMQLRLRNNLALLKQLEPHRAKALAHLNESLKQEGATLDSPADKDSAAVIGMMTQAYLRQNDLPHAADLLLPLLAGSQPLRVLALQQAMPTELSAATAAAWLDRVAPTIASDDVTQNVLLAEAWHLLGRRASSQLYRDKARAVLQPFAAANKDPRIFMSLGLFDEQQGQFADAQKNYRAAIRLAPEGSAAAALAANNLAMVLADHGGDLDEGPSACHVRRPGEPGGPNVPRHPRDRAGEAPRFQWRHRQPSHRRFQGTQRASLAQEPRPHAHRRRSEEGCAQGPG